MRRKLCIIALGVAALLVGCGTDVPDLSRVDNNVAAQYVADALLRGDKHYDESLDYDHSILEPTPEPTPVPTAKPEEDGKPGDDAQGGGKGGQGGQEAPQVSNVSLSELYGIPGVTIEQGSYEVKNSYSMAKGVSVIPGKGKKLAVAYFKISNAAGKVKKVKLTDGNVTMQLYLNGKSTGGPLRSIVPEDLQNFDEKIGAGKKKQGVLLFEIDKSVKIDKLEVQFSKGNRQAVTAHR